MSNEITNQQRQLIQMVLWMLQREALKLRGLQQVTDNPDRRQGQQDAIELIEESMMHGLSISEAEIEKVVQEVRARHKRQGN